MYQIYYVCIKILCNGTVLIWDLEGVGFSLISLSYNCVANKKNPCRQGPPKRLLKKLTRYENFYQ